jgi:AraC-like DNA-binding protein
MKSPTPLDFLQQSFDNLREGPDRFERQSIVFQGARFIRTGALEGFRDYVFLLGANPDEILERAGINPSLLDAPDTLINIANYRKALTIASEVTSTPRFGLHLSTRQSLDKFGPVGYLVRHAPTLEVALSELAKYLRVHDSGTLLSLDRDGDITLLLVQPTGVMGESTIQQCELAVGIILKLFRTIIAQNWIPSSVYFEHKRPEDLRVYERLFRCPFDFEQSVSAIAFPTVLLQTELITSNKGLFGVLRDYLERLNEEMGNDFVSQVRRVIHGQLENSSPRLDDVAEALGITRHVLQRRLKEEDTSFQKLQQAVRFEIAQRYLRDTDLSLIEISSILSLSEPAVFTRIFQKSAGMTPSEWRRKNRSA